MTRLLKRIGDFYRSEVANVRIVADEKREAEAEFWARQRRLIASEKYARRQAFKMRELKSDGHDNGYGGEII